MRRRDRIAAAQIQEAAAELQVVAGMLGETAKVLRAALICVGKIPPTAEDAIDRATQHEHGGDRSKSNNIPLAPVPAGTSQAAARVPRPAHLRVVRHG